MDDAPDRNSLYTEVTRLCWQEECGTRHDLAALEWRFEGKFSLHPALLDHAEISWQEFVRRGKLRKTGSKNSEGEIIWECEDAMRILRADFGGGVIEFQKTDYSKQVATNITLDWASGHLRNAESIPYEPNDATLRNTWESPIRRMLPNFEQSILANTVGVACMIFSRSLPGEPMDAFFRLRGGAELGELASMDDGTGPKLHCSASGSLELSKTVGFTSEDLLDGMRREIYSEVDLKPDEYDLFPVTFARELPRGGKPQFFFVALTNLTLEELQDRAEMAEEAPFEFVGRGDLKRHGIEIGGIRRKVLDQDIFSMTPEERASTAGKMTYEGYTCYREAIAYLQEKDHVGK